MPVTVAGVLVPLRGSLSGREARQKYDGTGRGVRPQGGELVSRKVALVYGKQDQGARLVRQNSRVSGPG